jgi:flap endonuclease-1
MGIKYLNKFLLKTCSPASIYPIQLHELKYKTLVIDTSIYLYKFAAADNQIIPKFGLLLSILKEYQITPIFIFDGKPPQEKKSLLIQRLIEKKKAEETYHSLLNETNENTEQMKRLKNQFIKITENDIQSVKELFHENNITYHVSPKEADSLCVLFVKHGLADACLSDDMDMFLYGCKCVLRELNIDTRSVMVYHTDMILQDLNMSQTDFTDIMILSGTDYNIDNTVNLYTTMKLYKRYKNDRRTKKTFYEWLLHYTNYINQYERLLSIKNMFCLDSHNLPVNNSSSLRCEK